MGKGDQKMYKVKIKGYGYLNNKDFGEITMEFQFREIEEAGKFIDTVIDHSDYTKFEIEYVKEV
jgi:hypothetical protein